MSKDKSCLNCFDFLFCSFRLDMKKFAENFISTEKTEKFELTAYIFLASNCAKFVPDKFSKNNINIKV